MKPAIIIILLIILFSEISFAQGVAKETSKPNNDFLEFMRILDSLEIRGKTYGQDEYIKQYLGFKLNKNLLSGFDGIYADGFSIRSSFIGEYKESLMLVDENKETVTWSREDSIDAASFHPVDAKEIVLKVADTTRVIIINEAHHIPQHRIFTTSLLKDLYDKGFRYLCLETLTNRPGVKDSLFKNGNYPELWSGFYTQEPLFGDMVRQALKIGYKVIPYEDSSFAISDRELGQAKNLAKIFEKDPAAKILVHCGYMHIKNDWMAGNLKLLTGINTFRIDQTATMEYSEEEFRNKYYQLADKIFKIDKPVFMTKGSDDYSFMFKGYVDAVLLLPKTQFNERPDWMSMSGYRKPYMILKTEDMNEPILVQAFYEDENHEMAVSVDMIIANENVDKYYLMLPKGKYNIVYRKSGNIILKTDKIEIN